jgi:hypothetical protein
VLFYQFTFQGLNSIFIYSWQVVTENGNHIEWS